MSQIAEKALFGLLTDVSSLETLVLEDFDAKFIPSAELRPIYEWAVYQFRLSGNKYAPTALMFEGSDAPGHKKSMAEVLKEYEIDIYQVPDETVEWCMEDLRSRWISKQSNLISLELGQDINEATSADIPRVFNEGVGKFVATSIELETKRTAFEMGESAEEILEEYELRKANRGTFMGLRLGLTEVDDHTNGIQDGELCVVAAPQKTGKSYMIDRIALKEFEAGRSVALFTLENSIAMTRDRIACLATGVHPARFEQGDCSSEEEEAVATWVHDVLAPTEEQLWIVSPPLGARTAESMISQARIRQADSVLIDQLTFVDPVDSTIKRDQQIREIVHSIKTLISTGSHQMPCVLTHQINRAGVSVARKTGFLHPEDMAEGAEVERTADWVFSMWQSDDAREIGQFLLQILASRRRNKKNWDVFWNIESGTMRVLNETALG